MNSRGCAASRSQRLEVLATGREELIDGIEHHAEDFAVLLAQPRIGKEAVLDDPAGQQTLRDAHEWKPIVQPDR